MKHVRCVLVAVAGAIAGAGGTIFAAERLFEIITGRPAITVFVSSWLWPRSGTFDDAHLKDSPG